jgi:hypothetical protein
MARPLRCVDFYLPLDYNDGQPIEEAKYLALQDELLRRFGGVPSVQRQFPLQGLWKAGAEVYQDRVVVFTVMDFSAAAPLDNLRYWERLKTRLKKKVN